MSETTPDVRDFKTAFCARMECKPRQFEKKLFWETVNPDLRVLVFFIRCFYPGFFRRDREYIQRIGTATNKEEILAIVNKLPFDPKFNQGFLRGFLRVRILGRRLVQITNEIF
jgi:hypothetical protein